MPDVYQPDQTVPELGGTVKGGMTMNWLRVLGTAELPHIDQGVRQSISCQRVVAACVQNEEAAD